MTIDSVASRRIIVASALATIVTGSLIVATTSAMRTSTRADGITVPVTVSAQLEDPTKDGSEQSVSVIVGTPLGPYGIGATSHQYGDPLCPVPGVVCPG